MDLMLFVKLSPSKFLRIKMPGRDMILVDKTHYKELFDAPEEKLSFVSNASTGLELQHTFNKEIAVDHYHAWVTKVQLTRHIPELMPAIVDELLASFGDIFKDIGAGINPLFFVLMRRLDSGGRISTTRQGNCQDQQPCIQRS